MAGFVAVWRFEVLIDSWVSLRIIVLGKIVKVFDLLDSISNLVELVVLGQVLDVFHTLGETTHRSLCGVDCDINGLFTRVEQRTDEWDTATLEMVHIALFAAAWFESAGKIVHQSIQCCTQTRSHVSYLGRMSSWVAAVYKTHQAAQNPKSTRDVVS